MLKKTKASNKRRPSLEGVLTKAIEEAINEYKEERMREKQKSKAKKVWQFIIGGVVGLTTLLFFIWLIKLLIIGIF